MESRLRRNMLEKVYLVWNSKGDMQVVMEFYETNNLFLLSDTTLRHKLSIPHFSHLTSTLKPPRRFCCFKTKQDTIVDHNYHLMNDLLIMVKSDYHVSC